MQVLAEIGHVGDPRRHAVLPWRVPAAGRLDMDPLWPKQDRDIGAVVKAAVKLARGSRAAAPLR